MTFKIKDLAEYYIDRYKLSEKGISDSPNIDAVKSFHEKIKTKIIRILQSTKIGSETLYDIIDPGKGAARAIDLKVFQDNCFEELVCYIEKNIDDYDHEALEKDKNKYNERKNDAYWEQAAKEFQDKIEISYETDNCHIAAADGDERFTLYTDEEINNYGMGMMIQAIYSVYFEDFKWDKLKQDMQLYATIDYNYGADNKPEQIKAKESLEDYRNYIGNPKYKNVDNSV